MKILPFICCFCVLLSCTSSKDFGQESLDAAAAIEIPDNFEISCVWANPIGNSAINALGAQGAFGPDNAGGRINIAGNTNYVRKIGDSLSIYVPYYGTRTSGATKVMNGSNGAIQFEGIPYNYSVAQHQHTRKNRTLIAFEITDDNGRHDFLITVYKSNKVTIDVNATHRSIISYEGTLGAYKE